MRKWLMSLAMFLIALQGQAQTVVTDEGAWCWFADPRALHYENETGSINATYIGYIDVYFSFVIIC